MKKILSLICILSAAGCETIPTSNETPKTEVKLSWNKPAWDAALLPMIEKNLGVYDKAKDIEELCPAWKTLSVGQRIKAVAEFYVALSFYESAWNEKSASVDVGSKDKRDTYSIGLLQISVVDQDWVWSLGRKYSYDQLLTAGPNLELGHAIMIRQINKAGEIILPNSSKYRYFAVLLEGNKYSKIPQIKERIIKNSECVK